MCGFRNDFFVEARKDQKVDALDVGEWSGEAIVSDVGKIESLKKNEE